MKQDEIYILYEDNHLLAFNKPANILTQPTPLSSNSMETKAKQWIKQRDRKKGNVFLHAIHRLDKVTSGVVLFAKTQKMLSKMTELFRDRAVKKTYLAIVQKVPKKTQLYHHIEHRAFKAERSKIGKECTLEFQVIEEKKGLFLLEIDLVTGRYHQIRAQLGIEGCPIIGDIKYGSKLNCPIHLHCWKLKFIHPIQQKEMEIVALPPSMNCWKLFFLEKGEG